LKAAQGPTRWRAKEQNYFPRDGLVLQYRPFIISQARWYSRKYFANFFDVLQEAVFLAHRAELKFDPARGSFGTLLQWELQRLHRWCQRDYRRKHTRQPHKYEVEDWERENARPGRERARAVCWHGGHHDFLDRIEKQIVRAAKVGLVRVRDDYVRAAPRNYKRWKAAIGQDEWPVMAEAIAAMRLANQNWSLMRDWMVRDLRGVEDRTMHQAAAAAGVTKSYASKIVCQIARMCVIRTAG
jgi:hypothetical protein